MTAELETPRLLLRPLALADAEQTQLLFPQWEIVRYLNNRVPWPATVERDYVSGRLPSEEWEITAEEWRARRDGFRR